MFYPLRIKTLLSQLGSSVTNGGGEKLSSVEDNDGVTPAEACPVAGEEENVDEGGGVERMDKCEEDEVELESNGEQQNTVCSFFESRGDHITFSYRKDHLSLTVFFHSSDFMKEIYEVNLNFALLFAG